MMGSVAVADTVAAPALPTAIPVGNGIKTDTAMPFIDDMVPELVDDDDESRNGSYTDGPESDSGEA